MDGNKTRQLWDPTLFLLREEVTSFVRFADPFPELFITHCGCWTHIQVLHSLAFEGIWEDAGRLTLAITALFFLAFIIEQLGVCFQADK